MRANQLVCENKKNPKSLLFKQGVCVQKEFKLGPQYRVMVMKSTTPEGRDAGGSSTNHGEERFQRAPELQ